MIIGMNWNNFEFEFNRIDFRHPEPRNSFRRRSSAIDFSQTNARRSSLAFRRSEQYNTDNSRRLSLLELKANGELKNLKGLVVKVNLIFYCFLLFSFSRSCCFFFQYNHINETLATDVQSKQMSPEHINSENIDQLRPSFVTHRPSQIHAKRARDSVIYKVINENRDNQSNVQ